MKAMNSRMAISVSIILNFFSGVAFSQVEMDLKATDLMINSKPAEKIENNYI